jgi:phosphatidate phosphatase APP1
MPNYGAASATTMLPVWGLTNPPVGLISDIDDTLTDTRVTHKLELLKNTFFDNTYDVKIFADAPEAMAALAGRAPSLLPMFPVFYVSGSPWALHERISQAFDRIGLPHGTMILRRYLQEPLDPLEFKLPHLREIVDAHPGYRWILFGDTGEKDPEVYQKLKLEHPDAVDSVFIHNVTNADPRAERYSGFTVFDNWKDIMASIQQRKAQVR